MDLNEFFAQNDRVAIAFSGGVDSSYLLYAAGKAGVSAKGYFVKSEFQPASEVEDAKKIAAYAGVEMEIIRSSILDAPKIVENDESRCYFCKKKIFSHIQEKAKADGFTIILDGTNASDDISDRPGYRVLQEMKVLSPLRICGLTKEQIRKRSKEAGLTTWDKPSYSCLATRIPTDTAIKQSMLEATEHAEEYLKSLGFTDFRIRYLSGYAQIQLKNSQLTAFLAQKANIKNKLETWYSGVLLDMETRE
ncbi:MAG TPA: ATP-dependent sacrificial sulfur transferase LarE [Sphaerochaeta sp.]|jgi:uncharacterized protein|nr:ATP-dependent sacrificial sulfur transferase LarE [Sphaerochaeta sp.]HQB04792.1 ATP-dependent sacrificial sulfur transferase LarE [Sphaerochaeta sp.]